MSESETEPEQEPSKYYIVVLTYFKLNSSATISQLKQLIKKLGFGNVKFFQSLNKPNHFEGYKIFKNHEAARNCLSKLRDESFHEYETYWKKKRKNHQPDWSIASGNGDWVWKFPTKKEMEKFISNQKKAYKLQRII